LERDRARRLRLGLAGLTASALLLLTGASPAGAMGSASHWQYGPAGMTSAVGESHTADGRAAFVFAVDTKEPISAVTSSQGTCRAGQPDGPDSFQCFARVATSSLDFSAQAQAPFGCAESFAAKDSFDGHSYEDQAAIVSSNGCSPSPNPGASHAGSYDLVVTIEPENSLDFDIDDSGWFAPLNWQVTVVNLGPETSPATTLAVDPPGLGSDVQCAQPRLLRMRLSCPVPALAAGDTYQTSVGGEVLHSDLRAGALRGATASVPCGSPRESDCTTNSAVGSASIAFAPHVRLHPLRGPQAGQRRLELTGSAAAAGPPVAPSAVARVQVAVLRIGPGPCLWLNRRGGLAPAPADRGRCDRPVWLPATGKSRWRYVIARGLRTGRYAAYARAISASGASDLSFSAQRRNAITIVAR
jgi:hypothetical protein